MDDADTLRELGSCKRRILDELAKVIVGQNEVIEQFLICMLANSHAVLVGVPGLAKTLLISTFARVLDLSFNRIQFTPDLMPSDITGSEILEENKASGTRAFRFVKGPVFANIVLADEINRTPPKTQSALLQAMQEKRVTVSGETHVLPNPFFVLATQNPIEQEGTYPLPEAQLDRFMFLINIDYPSVGEEYEIARHTTRDTEAHIEQIVNAEQMLAYQKLVRRVPVADTVIQYAVDLTRKTRPKESSSPDYVKNWLTWGAGPRASQHLILAAKARSALDGRPAPGLEDVRAVARPALRHRMILNFNAEAEGIRSDAIIDKLIA